MSPSLVLGPVLRYAGTTTATVWVETDSPTDVEVLGRHARTFQVEGHHYALVVIEDLPPGSITPYDVRLEDAVVWPPADGRPPCVIHTRHGEREAKLAFGSCRVGAPQTPPHTLLPAEDEAGVGTDALWAYSRELQAGEQPWPDALLGSGVCRRRAAGDRGIHPSSSRYSPAAGRRGRELRGVHEAVSRILVRPRHPLAAVHGPIDHDLRRPSVAVAQTIGRSVAHHTTVRSRLNRRLDPTAATGLALTLALAVVIGGGVLLALLAYLVRSNRQLRHLDNSVAQWGNDHAGSLSTHGLNLITNLAATWTIVVLAVIVAIVELARTQSHGSFRTSSSSSSARAS